MPKLPDDGASLLLRLLWSSYIRAILVVYLTGRLIQKAIRTRIRWRLMPPGPTGIPLLGNLLQVGNTPLRLKLTEWKEKYGPIYSLNFAGQPIVVLSTPEIAADLLERRAEIYSDRPPSIMGGQLMTRNQFLLFTPYSQLYTRLRRAAQEGLTPKAAKSYQPMQEWEASFMILNLLRDSSSWQNELKRTILSTICSVLYSWPPIPDTTHPMIKNIKECIYAIEFAAVPGTYLIDAFPWLLQIPERFSKWKKEGAYWYKRNTSIFEGIMTDIQKKRHEVPECFAVSMLSKIDSGELSLTEAAWTTGTVLGGGSGTSPEILAFFVLAMALYPDIMRRGQADIDAVVGRDRMPNFGDWDHLPYIHAIAKEAIRWKTVVPIGVPHSSTKDDWYNGYLIPKGSIMIPNLWAMHLNPDEFPEPERFNPDRFLTSEGKLKSFSADTHGQGHYAFGFGKRTCPGVHVANQALFLDIASLLWAFNMENAVDLAGKPIESPDSLLYDNGILLMPTKFNCTFMRRHDGVQSVVELENAKRARD